MVEFLLNPWVICIIVVSIVIGNLAALKQTANMKFEPKKKSDLDKLNELDKLQQEQQKKDTE